MLREDRERKRRECKLSGKCKENTPERKWRERKKERNSESTCRVLDKKCVPKSTDREKE